MPGPVQTATDRDIDNSGALDVSDFLNRRMNGVHVNEVQNNPFQPDVNYRGYTASPLLGTPQGLSVYMDGVRLNQPFGEVVSWDLIPRIAIASTTLMPGSNPLFGLNTLGGALSLQTKDGRSHPGTTRAGDVRQRRAAGAGVRAWRADRRHRRFHWYVAGNLFAEDGWRDDSPSDVRQIFGKVGWQRDRGDVSISRRPRQQLAHRQRPAGLPAARSRLRQHLHQARHDRQPVDAAQRLGAAAHQDRGCRCSPTPTTATFAPTTLNGDINEESLDQSLYQPGAAERAALAAAGYGTIPGERPRRQQHAVPVAALHRQRAAQRRAVREVQRPDQPDANRRSTTAASSGQVTHRRPMRRRARTSSPSAPAFDRSTVGFTQSTELGYLNPDRSVTGVGAFGDGGVTGGDADGEPYDTRVDLDGDVTTWSVFATDTLPLGPRAHLTLSGRYNRTDGRESRLASTRAAGRARSTAITRFQRFNPAAGVTVDVSPRVNLYAELQRRQPRRDVDRTGLRRSRGAVQAAERHGRRSAAGPGRHPDGRGGRPRHLRDGCSWNAGVFRAAEPRRHPVRDVRADRVRLLHELRRDAPPGPRARRAAASVGRVTFGAGYTFLRATFESEETVNGESNSTNDAAEDGEPGLEGAIEIEPGDRLPFIPQHLLKVFARRPGHAAGSASTSISWRAAARSRAATRTTGTNRTAPTTWARARSTATPSSISAPASR